MEILKKKLTSEAFVLLVITLFLFPVVSGAEGPSPAKPEILLKISASKTGKEPAKEILTLEEAVRIARDNQPRIRAAQARIKAQQAVLGRAMSAYYPTINLRNEYRSSLASGTTSTSQKAFDFFSSAANFNWTIYDFGKREGTVQEARDSLDSRRFAERTSVDDVILTVMRLYYRSLAVKALVRVREDTLKDRELLVRQAKGFFEVGTRPKIEVARAESGFFAAKADLIAAQNGVKIAWAELGNAVGVEDFPVRPQAEDALVEKPLTLLAKELDIRKPEVSLAESQKIASDSRPELKDFAAQLRAQYADIAVARRGHLPDISFFGQYGRRNTSRGGDTFPLQLIWQAGITIEIPIFSGFETTYEIEEALRDYREIKAREEETRQQIVLEVERSYLNVIAATERTKAAEAAVRSAKENLDLANGRYRVGVGSIIEITEAQVINTEAQTNLIQSLLDHKIAEAELARAMGQAAR
ncbi:MAG: TolC family protein [Candidatus Binatia bacterium]